MARYIYKLFYRNYNTIFSVIFRRACFSYQTVPSIQNHYIGDSVTLKCPTNDTTFFPTWSQGKIKETNERFLADNNHINPEAPRSWRLKLEGFDRGHYNLIIHNITETDSDIYCCSTHSNGTPYCLRLIVNGKYRLIAVVVSCVVLIPQLCSFPNFFHWTLC